MKRLSVFLLIAALLVAAGPVFAAAVQPPKQNDDGKYAVKILYAGLPDTDRAGDFMAFLEKHFEKVTLTDYMKFTGQKTTGYDVVILDHDGTDTQAPMPKLVNGYSRATMTMGVPGADIGSRLSLKTGYL